MGRFVADPLRREDLQLAGQVLLVEIICLMGFLLVRSGYRAVVLHTPSPATAAVVAPHPQTGTMDGRLEASLTPTAQSLHTAIKHAVSGTAGPGAGTEKPRVRESRPAGGAASAHPSRADGSPTH